MDKLKTIIYSKWGVVLIILGAVIATYLSLIWLPKDNPIEQAAEELIKEETGLVVDLTS